MLPTLVKTVLLYIVAFASLVISDRLNPHADDAGVGQSLLVAGVVALVLLIAFLYAVYKAVAQSSQWWAVVGLHLVLGLASLAWLLR